MNIINILKNQRRQGDPHRGRLYTQGEVDDLLEKSEDKRYQVSEAKNEIRAINRQKSLNETKVERLVKKSNRLLLSISSHALPFDIFPNEINIEEKRITIIDRHFISSEVHSIDINNISNIFINNSIIFSELVIISKTYEENEIKVKNLRTRDAVFARRIIEGLRVFEKESIDTFDYSIPELLAKLEELSTTQIVK